VRTIINATSTGIDAKTASRWSQALRYCWRQRDEWSDLQGFIRTHGGIAGCASAFANRKRQARTGKRARRDRSEKHHIAQPNADKSLMAMERLRRSAESFARPELSPPPEILASTPGTIVTRLASGGLWKS